MTSSDESLGNKEGTPAFAYISDPLLHLFLPPTSKNNTFFTPQAVVDFVLRQNAFKCIRLSSKFIHSRRQTDRRSFTVLGTRIFIFFTNESARENLRANVKHTPLYTNADAMTSTASSAVAATPQGAPQGPIYIDTQHDNMVHDAQLDYYGCKLATSSSGKNPT
jgi:hypothetical protein